jgi:hypothetical protein
MKAMRVLIGIIFVLAACCVCWAQTDFSGSASIQLNFSPPNPTVNDHQVEVRVTADLRSVIARSGTAASLTSFSMPIGFDPSFVRLISVSAGQSTAFSGTKFDYTAPAIANGKGFVTVLNTRANTQNPGQTIELARLVFELQRPGSATFIAGSARTVHSGVLAAVPADTGTPNRAVSWGDSTYVIKIGAGATLPSLLCPSWISVAAMYQGVALVNEGTEAASIQLLGWGPDGTLLQAASASNPSAPRTLAGGNQEAKVVNQLFDSNGEMNVTRGWIELRADTPDISGFFIQGTTAGTTQDGVPMTYSPSSRMIFPLVRDLGRANEIFLVNPNDTAVSFNMRVVGPSGQRTIPGTIPSHGTFSTDITDATGQSGVYVDVSTNSGRFVGVHKFGTEDSFAALSGQDPELASNRLSAPQFASGFLGGSLRIDTHFALVNPSSNKATVLMRLINDSGTEIASSAPLSIEAGSLISTEGWKLFNLSDPATTSTLITGTVQIESDERIIGALSFGDPVGSKYLAALPLMSTASARRQFFFGQVAVGQLNNVAYFTGLALANPSPTQTAQVNIELHSKEGSILARTTTPVEIVPGGRFARLVEELIPGFPSSQFGGYLRLTSNVEVYAYMLVGDNDYNILSAVPY